MQIPALMRPVIKRVVTSGLKKQLYERGIGRHAYEDIVKMGIADIDALAEFLGDKPFFFGESPVTFDTIAFAFISLTVWTPDISPVHARARSLPALVDYCQRMGERLFPEKVAPVAEPGMQRRAS